MNIGIDFDGVICATQKSVLITGEKLHGRKRYFKGIEDFHPQNGWVYPDNVSPMFFHNGQDPEHIREAFQNAEPIEHAIYALQVMEELGWKKHIITARTDEKNYPGTMEDTLYWLDQYGIHFDTIDFVPKDKRPFIEKYNLDVFIDDKPKNVVEIGEYAKGLGKENFKNFYFVHPWNDFGRDTKGKGTDAIRMYSWIHFLDIMHPEHTWK